MLSSVIRTFRSIYIMSIVLLTYELHDVKFSLNWFKHAFKASGLNIVMIVTIAYVRI